MLMMKKLSAIPEKALRRWAVGLTKGSVGCMLAQTWLVLTELHSPAFAFPPTSPDGSDTEPSGLVGGKANAGE
jgi:hypothetical protein